MAFNGHGNNYNYNYASHHPRMMQHTTYFGPQPGAMPNVFYAMSRQPASFLPPIGNPPAAQPTPAIIIDLTAQPTPATIIDLTGDDDDVSSSTAAKPKQVGGAMRQQAIAASMLGRGPANRYLTGCNATVPASTPGHASISDSNTIPHNATKPGLQKPSKRRKPNSKDDPTSAGAEASTSKAPQVQRKKDESARRKVALAWAKARNEAKKHDAAQAAVSGEYEDQQKAFDGNKSGPSYTYGIKTPEASAPPTVKPSPIVESPAKRRQIQLPTPEKSQGSTPSSGRLSKKAAGKKRKLDKPELTTPSKKRHQPMTMQEQTAQIAALQGKLAQFAAAKTSNATATAAVAVVNNGSPLAEQLGGDDELERELARGIREAFDEQTSDEDELERELARGMQEAFDEQTSDEDELERELARGMQEAFDNQTSDEDE
ncbi:hypothetical protein LTR08_005760 [Meristemomyces frigidus]|nr:hypothetical protein LTR08_005760 [Meristemomyces frigidus]